MNASSDLATSLMSYPTNAASISLVKNERGCLCKNTSKSRSHEPRTTGVRASRRTISLESSPGGLEVEIEAPPPRRSLRAGNLFYTTQRPYISCSKSPIDRP